MKRLDGSSDEGSSKILHQSDRTYVQADSAEGGCMMNGSDGGSGNNTAQQALDAMMSEHTECAACGTLVAGNLPMMDILLIVTEPEKPIIPGEPRLIKLNTRYCIEEIVCLECGKVFERLIQQWAESQDMLILARGGEVAPMMFAPLPDGQPCNEVRYKTIVETCDQTDSGGDFAYCWWLTDNQVQRLLATVHNWRCGRALKAAADAQFEPVEEDDR